MKNQLKAGVLLFASVTLLAVASLSEAAEPTKNVLVTIFDAAGVPAQDARLYVYDIRNKAFTDLVYKDEPLSLNLKPGVYRLYSSFSVQQGDHVARYASPEAVIDLTRGDILPVILRLREGEDISTQLSYSTVKKMGLEREVYPDLN